MIRPAVPTAAVRNHAISTHGVHHTSSRVSAQYPVTIQDTVVSVWYWHMSTSGRSTPSRAAQLCLADRHTSTTPDYQAKQQSRQGVVGIVAHDGYRIGQESDQQQQREMPADHRRR
jgi:hypothetical protein